jgi:hypothetical protein
LSDRDGIPRSIRPCPEGGPHRRLDTDTGAAAPTTGPEGTLPMPLTRRRLLTAMGAASAFAVTERGARVASAAVGRAVAAMRPATAGTTTGRCALCGSADHAMLDPRCPRSRPTPPVA